MAEIRTFRTCGGWFDSWLNQYDSSLSKMHLKLEIEVMRGNSVQILRERDAYTNSLSVWIAGAVFVE